MGRILKMCKVSDVDFPIARVRDIPDEEKEIVGKAKTLLEQIYGAFG